MAKEVIFYIAKREGKGEPWVRVPQINAAMHADQLTTSVQTFNTRQKELGSELRYKIVREVCDLDHNWMKREQKRIDDGTYRPMVTPNWRLVQKRSISVNLHYVHFSDKPGYVAYTASEMDGMIDKQTSCLAGTYLRKFFKFTPDVIDELRADAGETVADTHIHYSDVSETIVSVYIKSLHGPAHACMSYQHDHWNNGVHPCQVYGKPGNLALFWSQTHENFDDRDNTITARAIVNPELKVFGRIYGYPRDVNKLVKHLNKQGYTQYGTPPRYQDTPEVWVGTWFKTSVYLGRPRTPYTDFTTMMYFNPKNSTFTVLDPGKPEPDGLIPYHTNTNEEFAKIVKRCRHCHKSRDLLDVDGYALCRACFNDRNGKICCNCGVPTLTACHVDIPHVRGDWCTVCKERSIVECHECSTLYMKDDGRLIAKYNRRHEYTKRAKVCSPCYAGLIKKYRKWGNPNF